MLVMGIGGSPFRTFEDGTILGPFVCHDSAAVLLDDGEIVAAIETERLNRIKHTNKFPAESVRFCLADYGVQLRDLDALAYFGEQSGLDDAITQLNFQGAFRGRDFGAYGGAKDVIQALLVDEFNYELPPERICFVKHHVAHACSAFFPSGFKESLVVSIDAQGDDESGRILIGNRSGLETLATLPVSHSLGGFYTALIHAIGFQQFEEYKAMGLAPYGNADVFREQFRKFYTLLDNGLYTLNKNEMPMVETLCPRRKPAEEFTSTHADIAAAIQEALEEIVLHVLGHYRKVTGQRNLCIAGGVGHNCSLNGRILRSGMFDAIFVQPAAHDAGCAYGAALSVYRETTGRGVRRQRSPYWGAGIGAEASIEAALGRWEQFVEVSKPGDICRTGAELLAGGSVIGWVQGRSEFGPRALGNRSILADPRPAENKQRINEMVKKREAFRPFAPSVLQEHASEYFEVADDNPNFAYMIFVVNVAPGKRDLLGAVTHVDGTARIQTVSRDENPRYWDLISAFRDLTGVPVLLNTSFNNNAEPIVDSVDDAVTCFLTTSIDYVIVGDYLVAKKAVAREVWSSAAVWLPPHIVLLKSRRATATGEPCITYECANNFDSAFAVPVSPLMFEVLLSCDGRIPVSELIARCAGTAGDGDSAFYDELRGLWSRRVIVLRPGAAHAGTSRLSNRSSGLPGHAVASPSSAVCGEPI